MNPDSPRFRVSWSRIEPWARESTQQLERQFAGPPDGVVTEEDVHVVAGREERLDAGRPRVQLRRVVVVAAEPQVQERAGPANDRRLGLAPAPPGPSTSPPPAPSPLAPSSPSGGSSVMHSTAPASRSAAKVSSTCHERSWNSRTSGIDRGQAASRARMRSSARATSPSTHGPSRRISAGTRYRTVPSRSPNSPSGSVSHSIVSAADPNRPRIAEVRWAFNANRKSGGVAATQPRIADGVGPAPERRVQLDGGKSRGVGGEQPGRAGAGRVEAGNPVRVGEARGAGKEATPRGRVRQAWSFVPQARSATERIVRSTTSRSPFSIAERK